MSFDLSKLPLPDAISSISYQANFDLLVQKFKEKETNWNAYLESDPVVKILEACAFVLTLKDQQRNDQIKAVLISSAQGDDLDNLGALLAEQRDDGEDDDKYRTRIVTALSKVSSAGAAGAYEALALESDSRVVDVVAYDDETKPAEAFVAIQSNESATGVASADLLAKVRDYLTAEDKKPLGVKVEVSSIQPVEYNIDALVRLDNTADTQTVLSAMQDSISQLVDSKKEIAAEIALSEIYASLNIEGVAVVEKLSSPTQNIKTNNTQVPYCSNISIKDIGVKDVKDE